MGTPASTPKKENAAKRLLEEYVAWLNSVTFESDEEAADTLREILSETTIRLKDVEDS